MPNNLPTYAEILERVKVQDWGHLLQTPWGINGWQFHDKCQLCGSANVMGACEVLIAQAIQRAMVKALRWAQKQCEDKSLTFGDGSSGYSEGGRDAASELDVKLQEAADALEKEGALTPAQGSSSVVSPK